MPRKGDGQSRAPLFSARPVGRQETGTRLTEQSIYDHAAQFLKNINEPELETREPFGFASWKPNAEA